MSEHFSLQELTASSTALRLGLPNYPRFGSVELENLTQLAAHLENVRSELEFPMHIDSGYRSPELNAAVGGAPNSAHLYGNAVDFTCPQFGDPVAIVKRLQASGLKFDQLIQEGTWVHISFAPEMRQEVLTAHFVAGQRTTYTVGA